MVFKFILNILYTIGLVVCIITAISAFRNHNYPVLAGAVFVAALVFIFKLRLLKDIKNLTKKP